MFLIRRLLGAAAILASATSLGAHAADSPWTSLLVFGDSLSDPGNAAALTGGAFPGTGTGYFSNGPTAAELLAGRLGLPTTKGWPDAVGASNFAVGGATSGTGNFNVMVNSPAGLPAVVGTTGIANQIARYTPSSTDGNRPLYYLQGGANDFFFGFAQAQAIVGGGGTLPTDFFSSIVATSVTNMSANIASLQAKGAQTILLANLPDLGRTPFAQANGSTFAQNASNLSNVFNNAMQGVVAQYNQAGLHVLIADAGQFTRDATDGVLYPEIANSTGTWIGCMQAGGADCNGYFFWDDVHPTALGHRLFADSLYTVAMAAAVPEPESWAMLLAGAGVIAVSLRRRNKVLSRPA